MNWGVVMGVIYKNISCCSVKNNFLHQGLEFLNSLLLHQKNTAVQEYSSRDMNEHLLTIIQNWEKTKFRIPQSATYQASEFTEVTYGSVGEELLKGREMAQEYMYQPRYTPIHVAAHKSWKSGVHCTA